MTTCWVSDVPHPVTATDTEYSRILGRLHEHLQRMAVPGIQIDDNLEIVGQLGLDSIKVLDLIMEIEDEFDISIPMNVLTDVRTVRQLAEAIHRLNQPG